MKYLVIMKWQKPYPKELREVVEATNMGTASARAFRVWRGKNARQKVDRLVIDITRIK